MLTWRRFGKGERNDVRKVRRGGGEERREESARRSVITVTDIRSITTLSPSQGRFLGIICKFDNLVLKKENLKYSAL